MAEMFLTVQQVAERMQLHESTVRRQIRAGQIRSVRRGRVHRVPESALAEDAPAHSRPRKASSGDAAQADALWAQMKSGDARQHNAALRALFAAPEAVQAIVMRRSGEVAAKYYATPEGQAELADWRALDGEPFEDDAGDYYSPEEEAQFRAERERQAQEAAAR